MQKPDNLIGESDHFLSVLDHVSRIAPLNRPVLIIGERGTGKELIAKRLHYLSKRWDGPLVSLNCAALSEGLIDSELFGHEAGSFSGSKGRHKGRFERAEGGTLFLDELATSPLGVQEKLLRVIEYGEYERVGGSDALSSDVRLICATNEDLPALASNGNFRADLLDRLAFDVIHLPPLRERHGDILLLAEYYAVKMCRELGYSYFSGFSTIAQKTLLSYQWPGNVRELKNVIERAIYRHGDEHSEVDTIHLDPFKAPWAASESQAPEATASFSFPMDLRQWQTQQEKEIVESAMTQAKFNQRRAAELLGLSYHQIRGLLRKYNLVGEDVQDTV
ncbi:phage shock protein operon transcriptional activator [Enterovibrio nigricans]|uniref:Psp operon transcriptional activator n=1 Tax=Enterovibrio nigricans DSM 22720 TaxID=1121868 RepID=A0A1T4U559_9GAMM|nr:phage shock protein operon transcriptional activator [Enterovibrio nigricans]PKF50545.1 phage shock protein operon transcriptional activator [Enterovibrio nigricans]SKA47804.1 psp operon transcriptional activator [Enterovibrio nigricans DSM 22720]